MKRLTFLIVMALAVGCRTHDDTEDRATGTQQSGHDHKGTDMHAGHGGQQGMLMVTTVPADPKAGQPVQLKLMVHGKGGAMVKDFEVTHEQKVHLIVVRDGLDQFAHLHPDIDAAGNMTVSYTFPTGGTYLLFADYKQAGQPATVARATVKVAGDAPAAPSLTPTVPTNLETNGLRATVEVTNAKAGAESRLTFVLDDGTGKRVTDLQPYMGAMGHLVVLSADGKEYVHAHPADAKAANGTVAFAVHFTSPGLYKGWGQFRRGGAVRVVPFVVKVE